MNETFSIWVFSLFVKSGLALYCNNNFDSNMPDNKNEGTK